jgi:hemerythrin superfamily protein
MTVTPDAITLLEADHDEVDALFAKYDALGDRALVTKQELVTRISRELAIHTFIEEQILYPRVREAGRKIEDEVLEGLEEHHLIKSTLAELAALSPDHERFDAKVQVLKEQVEHHVEEEESDMFPRIRRAFDEKELKDLGAALDAAKATAPTQADPGAPDEPSATASSRSTRSVRS